MTPTVEELLEEFERLSLDDKVFLEFRSAENLEVSVLFKRAEPRPWSFWYSVSEEASRQTSTRQHVPMILRAFQVEERLFHKELANCLLLQAAFADEFVREVTEILGPDAVRESIRNTQEFMETLKQSVASLIEKSSRELFDDTSRPANSQTPGPARPASGSHLPSDSLQEPDPTPPSPGRRGLRIIRT